MNKISILFMFLFIAHVSFSQQPENEDDEVRRKENIKISNYNFLQQTLTYSALSYVCPIGLERGSPKEWYVLSADIIPQFVLGGEWTRFTAHLTARYKVRILHNNRIAGDSSSPVRTPSFMPGATMYYSNKRPMPEDKNIHYFSLSFFHHSNGQDGDEFKTDGTVNTYNGNFSTNYLEPAFHWRRRWDSSDPPDCKPAKPNYNEVYGRTGVEIYINTTDALRSSYGNQRYNLTLGFISVKSYCDVVKIGEGDKRQRRQVGDPYFREKWRVVMNATYIGGSRDQGLSGFSNRINADIQYYYRIPSSPNTSAFIGIGYVGSDTYNIYYQDSYAIFRVGIALGFFIAPKIVGSSRPTEVSPTYIEQKIYLDPKKQ